MKKILTILSILSVLCVFGVWPVRADVTAETARHARMIVITANVKTLHAADAKCPGDHEKKYWISKINTCTNDAQIIALTNRIDAARK